jgi:tetratricopeptide (TPR) repeat protein
VARTLGELGEILGNAGAAHTASGGHGREEFVRLFFALYRHQHTGTLDIQFGKKTRKLYFLGGNPIAYRSDLPEEDLGRTLANANLIPEKQINYLKEKLSEGENLEHAIVMSGALTSGQIAEHKQSRLQTSIGSPLLWGSGDWTFEAHSSTRVGGIDPALRPESDALASLWSAVQQHVSMDAVFPTVTDPKAGMVALDPLCSALFASFAVDDTFAGLPDAVGDGCSVEDIFRQVPDASGNLVKLLWFLETMGLVHREGRPHDTGIEDQLKRAADADPPKAGGKKPAAQKKASTSTVDPKAQDAATSDTGGEERQKKKRPPLTDDQLRAAHRRRIGRDFYSFLGVPPTAPKHAIDRKCKGLARRWRIPGKQRELPPDVTEKVEELLAGVQLVWRTLTDDKHRAEYDKRNEQGRAPKVGDLRTASSAPKPTGGTKATPSEGPSLDPEHEKARSLMAKGKHKDALAVLKKLRVDNPSNPDIMADLGWATWKLQGSKNGDAEEFLRLALTFDDRHLLGLEYLAKVLVEKGDTDTARVLVQRLAKLHPSSTWAKKALKNLSGGAQ